LTRGNDGLLTEFTPEQEQVFLGTMLGDANLSSGSYNSSLRVKHREADKEYLFWKYDILKSSRIFLNPPKPKPPRPPSGISWLLYSRRLPIFRVYREMFYPSRGEKIVPVEVLDKLELLGLAVWYMDDGHFQFGVPKRPNRRTVYLATQGFDYKDNVLVRDWMERKFGFRFDLVGEMGLRLGRRGEVERFLEMLRPFSVPCMERKFRRSKVGR